METTARNANLTDLVNLLRDQHARKLDVVAPASTLRSVDGQLVIHGAEQQLSEDGVTSTDGTYTPTSVCDEGIATKLGVPVGYLKGLREDRPDLYDANVNGWLHGRKAKGRMLNLDESPEWQETRPAIPGDSRAFMVRCFRGDDGPGIARAFLSDRYSVVDNIDVLMSCLDGVREAGVQVEVKSGDLTDRRMIVRVACPEVQAAAPRLLAGYRSPFTGATGAENPIVFAGFRLTNSETGGGAFTITPEVTVQVCNNGMTMTRDAVRSVHLGSRLDAGTVRWAEDTQQKNLALVQAKTRDAVATFLNADYLTAAVAQLEARAEEPVASVDAVRDLTKPLGYTEAHIDGILSMFMQGGQMNRAGVVNAITAYSQTVDDGDDAHTLDGAAVRLLVS